MYYINDEISLKPFDLKTDESFVMEINVISKSKFINDLEYRLKNSKYNDNNLFGNAYLIVFSNKIVGYIYLSPLRNGIYYTEIMIFKKYRGNGFASKVLDSVTEKVFEEFDNVKECRLAIDVSNTSSLASAEKSGFVPDEENIYNEKIDFIRDNMYFRGNRR